jgi:hypothetical protein
VLGPVLVRAVEYVAVEEEAVARLHLRILDRQPFEDFLDPLRIRADLLSGQDAVLQAAAKMRSP